VWLPLYHWGLALRRLLTAEWDDALAEIEVGLAVADEVGTRLHVPLLHGMASYIALHRGDLAQAQTFLDEAVREFLTGTSDAWQTEAAKGLRTATARWPIEWGLWIAGLLHEARGDKAQASALLEDAWAASAPLRYLVGFRFFGPDVVRLAMASGQIERARAVTVDVEEGARRSGAASAAAAALRCRGLVDADPHALLAAVHRLRPQPTVVELALTLEEAAAALAHAGRSDEAVAALEEALTIYERAGAVRLLARADAALRALGVRRRKSPGARRAAIGWESLTATELVVARLAAEGLTNRQVGERLFVSRRTVETHLAHVFAKLRVSGRAQLAVEVARHP
jgi:DNA-binding CsgD family transcriptional regulator